MKSKETIIYNFIGEKVATGKISKHPKFMDVIACFDSNGNQVFYGVVTKIKGSEVWLGGTSWNKFITSIDEGRRQLFFTSITNREEFNLDYNCWKNR
jgi:hypothetical protein